MRSITTPPDCPSSANHGDQVGNIPPRAKRSTAGVPTSPARTAARIRAYSGKNRTTCPG